MDLLLCFSDLQFEPQYLSLGFNIQAISGAQISGYKFTKIKAICLLLYSHQQRLELHMTGVTILPLRFFFFSPDGLSLNPLLGLLPNYVAALKYNQAFTVL